MATFLRTTQIPTHGAQTLPGEYFTSPEVYGAECERIFARRWLCVGREAQLAAAGDYFLVEAAGESVIVLRDRAGAVRAYYNVCRHRGARLCEAERGTLG
ncbi:MAG TPA: Rieske 2Fe-2S domain-containing protein, partial [Gemmatimonadaceae bacterium]|nr:Rieske 2Fe-2S domain-containing protein [Gemmatimonadaceae bacterium]